MKRPKYVLPLLLLVITVCQAVPTLFGRSNESTGCSNLFQVPTSTRKVPFLRRDVIKVSGGLTLAPCVEQADCVGDRLCIADTASGPQNCPKGNTKCTCRPKSFTSCQGTSDCPKGEQCITSAGRNIALCISAYVSAYRKELTPKGATPKFDFGGLTLDPCDTSSTCDAGRQCVFFPTATTRKSCSKDEKCFCFPETVDDCKESSDCVEGEVCSEMKGVPDPFCVAETAEKYWQIINELLSGQDDETPEPPRVLRGVTYDDCRDDHNCLGGRKCVLKQNDKLLPCIGKNECRCQPEELDLCQDSTNCETREFCAKDKRNAGSKSFCASAVKVRSREYLEEVTTGLQRPDKSAGFGLSGFPCKDNDGCKPGRSCRDLSESYKVVPCASNKGCRCFPDKLTICEKTAECDNGEVCVHDHGHEGKSESITMCVSADVEASSSQFQEVSKGSDEDAGKDLDEDGEKKGPTAGGVTFDPCHDTDACEEPRKCISRAKPGDCKGQKDCYCKPPKRQACASMKACQLREVCAKNPKEKEDGYYCVSKFYASQKPEIELIKTGPAQEEKSKSEGLTFYPCKENSQCKGERKCHSLSDEGTVVSCKANDFCFCAKPEKPSRCSKHGECENGEVCSVVVKGFGAAPPFLPDQFCAAPEAVAGLPYLQNINDPHKHESLHEEGDDSPILKGVTFDPCKKSEECYGVRTCITLGSGAPCNGQACICHPPKRKTCTFSKDCSKRERCVTVYKETETTCVSGMFAISDIRNKAIPNDQLNEEVNEAQGKTLYPCKSESGCIGERSCLTVAKGGALVACEPKKACMCLPKSKPERCVGHSDCKEGEVCSKAQFKGALLGLPDQACVSADVEAGNPFLTGVDVKKEEIGPDITSKGVTFDYCRKTEDCAGKRTCIKAAENQKPCDGATECVCIPDKLRSCSSQTQCEPREECATGEPFKTKEGATAQYCISAIHVGFNSDLKPVKVGPPKQEFSQSRGLNGWPCRDNFEICKGERKCVYDKDGKMTTCDDSLQSSDCYCYTTKEDGSCKTDAMCEKGEVCAKVVGEDKPTTIPNQVCVASDVEAGLGFLTGVSAGSKVQPTALTPSASISSAPKPTPSASKSAKPTPSETVSPTPSVTASPSVTPSVTPSISASPSKSPGTSSTSGVCVDAEALSHLSADELVFERHALSKVLCDKNESCATPGHVVAFEGQAMMMKSYCNLVGCEEREMLVNSPKYRMKLRVKSKTEGLLYTAFAARYETRAEEVVMMAAVHAGL